MNGLRKLIKFLKRLFKRTASKRTMYNLRRRRESVAMVCRKTTKFLTANTGNLLKRSPNTKKYRLLAKIVEEFQNQSDEKTIKDEEDEESEDDGERDLDYYLGVRKKDPCWRDQSGTEQIIKDYLIYHCGVSEEDYNRLFGKSSPKPTFVIQPKLKQVPFKIHRKKEKKHISFKEGVAESWAEKTGIFKLFGARRDSDTSESYSECDSNNDRDDDRRIDDIVENLEESVSDEHTLSADKR